MNVDVQLVRKTRLVSLAELREHKALEGMILLKRGNRLSITPVTPAEWKYITGKLIGKQ
jgi:predicted RNA-binding protein with PUA-like domain